MGSKTRGKSGGRRETLPSGTRDYHSVHQLEDDIFGLGYDVALRILLLPLKSIFMLKWVSKRWLAAISDPRFRQAKIDLLRGLHFGPVKTLLQLFHQARANPSLSQTSYRR